MPILEKTNGVTQSNFAVTSNESNLASYSILTPWLSKEFVALRTQEIL